MAAVARRGGVEGGVGGELFGGRIERVHLATGKVETLYRECNGHALRGPNDIVFDKHGGFYFTDLGKVRHTDMDRGGVFYSDTAGNHPKVVAHPAMTPNGVALSPDGRTLYFYNGRGAFVGLSFSSGPDGKPQLGAERTLYNRGYVRNWTMSPDGSSLIFIDTARLLRLLGLEVVLNLQPGS